jgi:hypothetical protein
MVEVETGHFEFANGRKPRGRGHWAFEFLVRGAWVLEWHPWAPELREPLFSTAKRWAASRAKQLGAARVRVAS